MHHIGGSVRKGPSTGQNCSQGPTRTPCPEAWLRWNTPCCPVGTEPQDQPCGEMPESSELFPRSTACILAFCFPTPSSQGSLRVNLNQAQVINVSHFKFPVKVVWANSCSRSGRHTGEPP